MMRINIEKGSIVINLYDLIGSLDAEHRAELIDAISCQSEVIDEVMNQVLDGTTTLGSYAATGFGGNHRATFGIDGARMRIAKASSEVAAKEIERLGQRIELIEAQTNKGWAAYHELLNSRRSAYGTVA